MAIREQVLDEAIASAKARSHAEVEPRHVLWGLITVLGTDAPSQVSASAVRRLLEPDGSSATTPTLSESADHELSGVSSVATARSACEDLGRRLVPEGPTATSAFATAEAEVETAATPAVHRESTSTERESTSEILAELDSLIGLGSVKSSVRRLIAVQRLNAERRANGLPEVNTSNHIVFTGDPGTGKTTVARLIARLYGSIGVVSRGHLVEAARPDLVAGYVGQTALKVQSVVERARGGVLFIDEAYALTHGDGGDFGSEAVATLVKLMEDYRKDLAVIVAGYPDEMREFVGSNPGLRSRFTHYVDFPDYDTAELVQIFCRIAEGAQVTLTADAMSRLTPMFEGARKTGNFGNARFARSTFEIAYANMAHRALEDDRIDAEELHEMTLADLPMVDLSHSDDRRPIGFRRPA